MAKNKNILNRLDMQDCEKARDNITASSKKEIKKLYSNWAADIAKTALKLKGKTNISYILLEKYYRDLEKQLRNASNETRKEIEKGIKTSLYKMADSVVYVNSEWLKSLGFPADGVDFMFSSVPKNVINNLVTGNVYKTGWSLSNAIWGNEEKTLKTLYEIIAGGRAKNISIYEISKDLEKYVKPGAKKPWNLTAPDGRRIYPKQVDYNAQRLARTLIQHTYQQSFVATTEKNPFVLDYTWLANGSRVCERCKDLDGQVFKKDELPLDHPNGMCVMVPNVVDNLVDRIADWVNSPDGTYPEIDDFSKNFGYTPKTIRREVRKRI